MGRGRRGRRGDVRAAVLALLAERPMHGYEMLSELEARTDGVWRPSPGSMYPALAWLEDQGLVRAVESDGRKRYELTDSGRAEQEARTGPSPWDAVRADADEGAATLWRTFKQVAVAVGQVAEAGTAEQRATAGRLLGELRRQLYLLLAEQPEAGAPTDGPTTA
ncbi:MAG TPA: PadR family transcriptional regulator [Acidimicrobiales bacterium]|nr:PadR family transcriptional regulator [Acidimicrobiales bacterium]